MLIIDNQLDDLELVDSSEPICGECYQEKAVWKCHMCGSGPKPTYYCDQHRDNPPEHNREKEEENCMFHELIKIEMDEEMRRNHFEINVKPKLEQFKKRLEAERKSLIAYEHMAKDKIDQKLDLLMEQFVVEIERRRKNLKEEVEAQVIERKARIKEHEMLVSKELEKKYEIFRRHHEAVDKLKRYSGQDQYQAQVISKSEVEVLEEGIMELLNKVREYKPLIGPYVDAEIDFNIKSIINNMFSHKITMKRTMAEPCRFFRPMTPGITQLYQASRIGNWCLHNIPLIVVPHPDYKENNGDAIQAQLRMECSIALAGGMAKRVESIHQLSNRIGLIKFEDGIVRRICIRYLDSLADPSNNTHSTAHILQLTFHSNSTSRSVDKTQVFEHFSELLSQKEAITRVDGHNRQYLFYMKDFESQQALEKTIREGEYDQENLGRVDVKRRSNVIVSFVDEIDLEPLILDGNKKLEYDVYQMDHNYDFISQQPLCTEVWIDDASQQTVSAFEPLHKSLIHPEFGCMMRSLLNDSEEFKVEYLRMYDDRQPWSWVGKITCGGENLADRAKSLQTTRGHFPIPKFNGE